MKPMPLVAVTVVMLCITLQIAETTTELQHRVHENNLGFPKEYVIEKTTMLTLITNQPGDERTIKILKSVIDDEKNFQKIVDAENLKKNLDFLDKFWFNYLKPCAGAIIGGVAGAAIGSYVSPEYGTAIGGIVGGIAGAIVVSPNLSNWIIENFLILSKEEALENAYNFLQLENGASNNQIDSNFERLALEYHPDKFGNYDDLLKLSLSKGYIQMFKGE